MTPLDRSEIIFNELRDIFDNMKKDNMKLHNANINVSQSFYNLRSYIDDARRKKINPEEIVTEIYNKLIPMTPNGPNNISA